MEPGTLCPLKRGTVQQILHSRKREYGWETPGHNHPNNANVCTMTKKYSKISVSSYAYLPKSEVPDLLALKDQFTLTPKFSEGAEGIRLYDDLPEVIGIPRYAIKPEQEASKVEDLRVLGGKWSFTFTSQLRPAQAMVIQRFQQHMNVGTTGFILEAPPGFGKTVTILKMLEILRVPTCIIVPRSNLVKQWVQRIQDHTDIKANRIGCVNGKHLDWQGKNIVVGLVHTIARLKQDSFFASFGASVYDEVDRSVPPATFAPVVGMFPTLYRIGASATIRRRDGMHKVFQWHIGECHLRGNDEGRMKPKALVIRWNQKAGKIWGGGNGNQRRGQILSKVAGSTVRNKRICHYIRLIYNSGRRLVVMSDRTLQLSTIREFLVNQYGIPKEEIGFYASSVENLVGTKRKVTGREKKFCEQEAKVILATYGMMAIGTDIPDLAGMVLATPQSDMTQTAGRIERMAEGKLQPVIVDFIDMAYPDSQRWGNSRLRQYRTKSMKVKVTYEGDKDAKTAK